MDTHHSHSSSTAVIGLALTAVLLLALAGLGTLAARDDAGRYWMVDELLASDIAAWQGAHIKLHGYVEAGSIVEKRIDGELHRTFLLAKGGKRLRVFSTGVRPETLKDGAEVVAVGELVGSPTVAELAGELEVPYEDDTHLVLDSSELMAKCTGKYEGGGVDDARDVDRPFGSRGAALGEAGSAGLDVIGPVADLVAVALRDLGWVPRAAVESARVVGEPVERR
jgi:cytochrome c-type biogenesis protein CcmE